MLLLLLLFPSNVFGGLRAKPSHGRKLTTKENTQALLVAGRSLVYILVKIIVGAQTKVRTSVGWVFDFFVNNR